jgi:phage/plasmid-associated DNA primase
MIKVIIIYEMVEILFILHGGGQNGKSTEFETISGVLGDYAHAADAQVLLSPRDRGGATPEIVSVKGKRVAEPPNAHDNRLLLCDCRRY